MKIILSTFIALTSAFMLSTPSHAVPESQAAALLLLIEPGARQAAMGEAHTAIADDALAGYYNPAGLAFQNQTVKNLQFMHTNWLAGLGIDDMYYEHLAYTQYVRGWGRFAVNLTYFNLGEQERTSSTGDVLGTFHSNEVVLSGSYGATMTDNLSLGITLKGIYSKLAELGQEAEKGKGVGTSFALDFGLMYQTPYPGLTLAAVINNLGPKISYIDVTQADPLPLNFIAGVAYVPINDEFNRLTFALDIYKPLMRANMSPIAALFKGWTDDISDWDQIDFKIGGEYVYNNFIAFRAGYSYDKDGDLKSPTFGVGIIYDRLTVDIAYYGGKENPMSESTRFSLGYSF